MANPVWLMDAVHSKPVFFIYPVDFSGRKIKVRRRLPIAVLNRCFDHRDDQ
jgi:hypothetical protein